jgi:Alternative complex III, ActD subunit
LKPRGPLVYGMMAEFDTPEALVSATRETTAKGFRKVDAYSPFPIEELTAALRMKPTKLPLFVLCMGIFGCSAGFFMQWFASTIHYPINIGGRPLNSWPAFIPITFEMTILFAALGAVVGMMFRNGLPRPYHPVFNVKRFELASQDKFFLCIEAADELFNRDETERFLKSLNPTEITLVEHVPFD